MAFRILLAFAVACLTIPALAQESQSDVVLKRDKLIVGTYSTSPPLAYVDDKGDLRGFEIDMAHEIAKDLLGDPNRSNGRFPAALSGKIDFGLCSTTIFLERAIRIAFTRPDLDTGNSFIVSKNAGIRAILQRNDAKYTFANLNVPPAIDVNGTIFAYVSQDALFLKPGDFKWWLVLDTWVGELRSGTRCFKYAEWYHKWQHKDLSPQQFHDFNEY
jgi:polar amino acid transport system substrate-binding protein